MGRSRKQNVELLQAAGGIENRPLFLSFFRGLVWYCFLVIMLQYVRCFVGPLAVDVSLYILHTLAHAYPLMYVSRLVRTQLTIHNERDNGKRTLRLNRITLANKHEWGGVYVVYCTLTQN